MSVSPGLFPAILAAVVPATTSTGNRITSPLRMVWDLHVSPDTTHVTDWLAKQGWCWAIETPPSATAEVIRPLQAQGFVIIGQIHGHPATRTWHWSFRSADTPDMDAFIELIRESNASPPRIQFFVEDDSAGVGFSAAFLRNPPATHGEAKAMFDEYLDTAMEAARQAPDVTPWAIAGFAGTTHHYARHGVKCVIVERANDDVEDLQTAIAFARGAARQFGCEWGIDLSLWWGVIYGCVQNLCPSLYTRHLWLSYIGGAQAHCIEGGDLLVRPEGPTVVAKAIDAFAKTAQTINPGAPDTPVAVMLPQDHGWMTPPYWRTTNEAWNYARLPYRQGDRGIDGFFGAAFPGSVYAQDPFPKGVYQSDDPPASPFALSCITPEFAPTPEHIYNAEPPLSFGAYADRTEAQRDFAENNTDPSTYRAMGDARWGDIIDVLTDDVTADVMQQYRTLILLGPVSINEGLRERLLRFVRAGGALVWAAGVATPREQELVGVAIQPELRVGRDWRWSTAPTTHEAFRFCPLSAEALDTPDVEVLATTRGGAPLVLKHRLGNGAVYTCLIPWFEGGHTPLCGLALHLFDHVIQPIQPVLVTGPPASWASARSDRAVYVVAANHDETPWEGTLTVRDVPDQYTVCRELISDKPLSFQRDNTNVHIPVTIAPYGTCVLEWTHNNRA